MNRYLIFTFTSWLLMLLPVALLLQRVMQAEHFRLVWASLALAPFVAWLCWQAISKPVPKVRFAVLQWLGIGYSLAIALIITVPLIWMPMTTATFAVLTVLTWLIIFFYGLYNALFPQVHHIKLRSSTLSRRWRIVQISDVHVGSRSASFLQKNS